MTGQPAHPPKSDKATVLTDHQPDNPLQNADRDLVALGIASAAVIMLIGTGGSVLPQLPAAPATPQVPVTP